MGRRVVIAVAALALFTGTLAVVWSGLAWPPLLWIIEYGLPASQGPTGRVAVVGGIEFVELSPGYFLGGSHTHCVNVDPAARIGGALGMGTGGHGEVPFLDRSGWFRVTCPRAWSRVRSPLWIARREITNRGIFSAVTDDERRLDAPDEAAGWVRFEDALRFCARLSANSGGIRIRLPDETEWEYAARAGSRGRFAHGDSESELTAYASRGEGEFGSPAPPGTRRPNRWGLYDMAGNVAEWCSNWWEDTGPPGDLMHVIRGGWTWGGAEGCEVAARWFDRDLYPHEPTGVRPAFTLGPGQEHLVDPYLLREE